MCAFVVLGLVFPYQAKRWAWGLSLKLPILCWVGHKTLTQSIGDWCLLCISLHVYRHWICVTNSSQACYYCSFITVNRTCALFSVLSSFILSFFSSTFSCGSVWKTKLLSVIFWEDIVRSPSYRKEPICKLQQNYSWPLVHHYHWIRLVLVLWHSVSRCLKILHQWNYLALDDLQ